MALEAVVFQQDFLGSYTKDLYNMLDTTTTNSYWNAAAAAYDFALQSDVVVDEHGGGGGGSSSLDFLENQTENFHHHHLGENSGYWINPSSSSYDHNNSNNNGDDAPLTVHPVDGPSHPSEVVTTTRPKRRRAKSRKNKEEIENQRMTHIAVERNRRKQMNEYLAVLRSLMPESYVQRGDQASIIGGAINFVKELEHKLQLLGGHKDMKHSSDFGNNDGSCSSSSSPFSEFFTFPQYSSSARASSAITDNYCTSSSSTTSESGALSSSSSSLLSESSSINTTQNAIADIEVTMVETHANLKIRSKRRPKQLLKVVSGLQNMRLNILHLNVTSVDQFVLYSLCVKVEDDCKLTSVDDIATAVYQLLCRIQEELPLPC